MKKVIILMLLSIAAASVYGQKVMKIHKKNGKVISINVSDIDYIKYVDTGEKWNETTVTVNHRIEGMYSTSFNDMTIHIGSNHHVTGTYKFKSGKIDGYLNGNILTGTWTQSNAKGRLRFVFSNDFSSFEGKWGYNNAAPTSKWNGTKK